MISRIKLESQLKKFSKNYHVYDNKRLVWIIYGTHIIYSTGVLLCSKSKIDKLPEGKAFLNFISTAGLLTSSNSHSEITKLATKNNVPYIIPEITIKSSTTDEVLHLTYNYKLHSFLNCNCHSLINEISNCSLIYLNDLDKLKVCTLDLSDKISRCMHIVNASNTIVKIKWKRLYKSSDDNLDWNALSNIDKIIKY